MAPAAALVFAGKSVAIPAISFLVNKAFAYLNQYWKTEGIDEMKSRILLALPKIRAVFDVVNPERIKEESIALDAWLWHLRDAVEKAEDAVDEIEYYELKEKAKDLKEAAESSGGFRQGCCRCCGFSRTRGSPRRKYKSSGRGFSEQGS
ncbi:uncharacterized protein LOC101764444 isoform X3 [Setaria italica]|uniref:uncharacterized protein LOC101764444 isoform X3 n=1 Tax=Setaria italica TaxID=4555 RepID=UPI000BE51859|nr:uncharacterized protein LOC101764444 isoform X3 [Setaria italica]